jgi:hypothetical protein
MPAPTPPLRFPPAISARLRSLKVKFVAAMLLMVGVVIGLSTWWNLEVHRGHMVTATEDKIRALTDAIDRRIYTIMREGHIQDLQRVLEESGRDPDIDRILIFNPQGVILRASRPELVGQQLDRDRVRRILDRPETVVADYFEAGRQIHSMVRKIRNGPECVRCHGTTTELNGILHVDMSFQRTEADIAEMERSALWTVILTAAVLAAGGGLLMTRMVERPLAGMVRAMGRVEAGDLGVRVHHASLDEIGRLADGFNTMVHRLEAARAEIEAYHRDRLDRAERLASLGELAASLAHEIKNPLAGIDGAIQVMADELPDTDSRKEIMLEVLSQVRRLDRTVRDLLAFARPGRPEVAPCDLHQILDRVLLLLAEDPDAKRIRVTRAYQTKLPRVEADAKQLGQVFLNLILNAIQAMPAGGSITLRTSQRPSSDGDGEPGTSEPGLEVELSDTGPGIPPRRLEEIFTPFVTTKHRGTGLGLSVSRRIVEDHRGRITAENRPEGGAAFRVWLPLGPSALRTGGQRG